MTDPAERNLIEAARRGEADALEDLLSRLQPRVYRFSMKMCREPEDAKDVLQETLLAAARTVRGFRGASSVSTWLYTIARSFCIKKRRRRAGAAETVSLDTGAAEAARDVADAARGPDALLQDKEIASALDGAIAALEPVHREVLLLRDVEGLPASEVAEITGLSVPAVKSRLHRARARVRERLAPALAPAPAAPPAPAPALPAAAPSAGCPDVVGLLSRHLEGEIGPDACAELERHVAGCPRCGTLCDSLRETLRLCGATALPAVPPALQESIREGIRSLLARQG